MTVRGKVAIITGASRGIGREIAITLASEGASVVLTARNATLLDQAREEIASSGGNAICVPLDIQQIAAVEDLVHQTVKHYGRIDILVNNAAVSPSLCGAEKISPEDWDLTINTNLRGTFFCTQVVGKQMIKQRHGVIITVTSFAGVICSPGTCAYNMTKAGLIEMTRTLAVEWAQHGIRVNSVAPGLIETDINKLIREKKGRFYEWTIQRTPMRHWGKAEDIAKAVLFLASDDSNFITGATLFVDGGLTAA